MSDFSKLEGYDVKDAYARSEIALMKINFQDGVDTIYNAIVAQGITPSSSTPSDCATAISQLDYQGGYDAGRSQGRKDIGENAQVLINGAVAGSSLSTISNLTSNHYYIITTQYKRGYPTESIVRSGAVVIASYSIQDTYQLSSGTTRYIGSNTFLVKSTSDTITIENLASPSTKIGVIDLGACQ